MNKKPFTQSGLNALREEIRNLPKSEKLRVAALQQDYISWANKHLEFENSQQIYLVNLSSEFVSLATRLTALAISNDEPIRLIKAEKSDGLTAATLAETDVAASSADAEGKLITLGYTSDPDDAGIEVLTYEIRYTTV
ncbi:hypothetical protein [Pedobacter sp. BMA]|uniref:hypothetical protein n=1 Tax=Pedobacter sp. BMA TaxID=1663685 RepID=UPI00064B3B6E|nr:hypothetical protein [Pedobacter sp. BMA]KLT64727.1 hypothetical protein AB669_13330 [Pedobacter sp. BMA]